MPLGNGMFPLMSGSINRDITFQIGVLPFIKVETAWIQCIMYLR